MKQNRQLLWWTWTTMYHFERWRTVPSDPTLEASSLGRLRVVPYQAPLPNGGVRTYGGEPTLGQWDGFRFIYCRRGYPTRKAHRLICEAFHGPCPNGMECIHIDEDASNNKPTNLKWGTHKENMNYPKIKAYHRSRTGEKAARYAKQIRQTKTYHAGSGTQPCLCQEGWYSSERS